MNILIDMRGFVDPVASNGKFFSVDLLHAFFRNSPSDIFYLWTTGKERLSGKIAFEEYHNVRRIHTQISEKKLWWWNFFTNYPAIDDVVETMAMRNGHLAWTSQFDIAIFMSPSPKILEQNCVAVQVINHLSPLHFPRRYTSAERKNHKKRDYKKSCQQADYILAPFDFTASCLESDLKVPKEKVFISGIGIPESFQRIEDSAISIQGHLQNNETIDSSKELFELQQRWKKLPKTFFFVRGIAENYSIVQQAYAMYKARYGDDAWDIIFEEQEENALANFYVNGPNTHILSPLSEKDRQYILSKALASIDPSPFDEEGVFIRQSLRTGCIPLYSEFGVLAELVDTEALKIETSDIRLSFDPFSWKKILDTMKQVHSLYTYDFDTYEALQQTIVLQGNDKQFSWDTISEKIMLFFREKLEERETEE